MNFTKSLILGLLVIASLPLIFGCGKSDKSNSEKSVLRISTSTDALTLDPRLGTDLTTATILRSLYEGLMRTSSNGKLIPGVAESARISKDHKTYTFTLRDAYWSDDSRVTAYDFEETWKSLLDPKFPAANAYQFFMIAGAKAYKEGKGTADQVGIKALDDKTLVIKLEVPNPYFLKLTATHFYFPVNKQLRDSAPNSPHPTDATFVSNGPFKLYQWKRNNELVVEKNPSYWDNDYVLLNQIAFIILDENTAYNMYEGEELDWIGSPLSTLPQDAVSTLKNEGNLEINPGAGTHWFRFNTENTPFDHVKIRRAFALALDKQAIVDHITQGNQLPANKVVPPILLNNQLSIKDHDLITSSILFEEALKEMNLAKEQLPKIVLSYQTSDRGHKIAQAVQQQWQVAFGIPIEITNFEKKTFYDKVKKHDYQIALGSWFADIQDPINFLEVFKYKNDSNNNTGWENEGYTQLLNASDKEMDFDQRNEILSKAEAILLEHMPVAPLFFASFNSVKSERVNGVYFSELGILDFKHAFIDAVNTGDLEAMSTTR